MSHFPEKPGIPRARVRARVEYELPGLMGMGLIDMKPLWSSLQNEVEKNLCADDIQLPIRGMI